jgi:hypothetical protein
VAIRIPQHKTAQEGENPEWKTIAAKAVSRLVNHAKIRRGMILTSTFVNLHPFQNRSRQRRAKDFRSKGAGLTLDITEMLRPVCEP